MQTPPPEDLKTNEETVPIEPPITENMTCQALPISTLTPPPENGCDEGSVLNQEQTQRCADSGKKQFFFTLITIIYLLYGYLREGERKLLLL